MIHTGLQENLRRFIELTALELGWGSVQWEVEGVDETGRRRTDEAMGHIDPRYVPSFLVETLLRAPSKAIPKLGWKLTTILVDLVTELVEHYKEETGKKVLVRLKGFKVVGSLDYRPTNSRAVEQTRGSLDG